MFDADLFEKSVVLVSVDPETRSVLRRRLIEQGMTVFEATSQVEALDLLADEWIDAELVIIDLEMPEMVGVGLARIVGAWRPELPVLILTPSGGGAHLEIAGKAAELLTMRQEEGEPN